MVDTSLTQAMTEEELNQWRLATAHPQQIRLLIQMGYRQAKEVERLRKDLKEIRSQQKKDYDRAERLQAENTNLQVRVSEWEEVNSEPGNCY